MTRLMYADIRSCTGMDEILKRNKQCQLANIGLKIPCSNPGTSTFEKPESGCENHQPGWKGAVTFIVQASGTLDELIHNVHAVIGGKRQLTSQADQHHTHESVFQDWGLAHHAQHEAAQIKSHDNTLLLFTKLPDSNLLLLQHSTVVSQSETCDCCHTDNKTEGGCQSSK